ncbi:hypothetical protein [Parerythrobacter jejuensis]|uniref:Uncharacterized protein n=1 Tax=Parerythrobacter jejuensis TaxID=795812 RepID=A0A845AYE9_9SPHN|nr:hypothetical protein [Parerythrobacter jejuensis]MXP31788.1 hypothetical protein [Parerythrobacter jejuensis]
MLAQTRSVAAAARFVGMGRESAYRLRGRPGAASFCAAWDAALGKGMGKGIGMGLGQPPSTAHHATRKSTLSELEWRVETGLWQVILHHGRYLGVRKKLDNSALLMLTRRIDRIEHGIRDRAR